MQILDSSPQGIERAVELLKLGQLVAFPTETVYGLGADASKPEVVRKIFAAKGRPADHPLIVHLPAASTLSDWALDIPDSAWALAGQFWPGPMALVLKKRSGVSDIITGGQDTIGLRVPSHPVAQQLLKVFAGALAAPSANRFGRISPTTAAHVIAEFGQDESVAAVIDGGACTVGVESTIIDLSGSRPTLLRPGMISAQQIEQVLGQSLLIPEAGSGPRAPGRLPSHYAPTTPLKLASIEHIQSELNRSELPFAVLAFKKARHETGAHHWQCMPSEPDAYAHELYAQLRAMDQGAFKLILVEQPPTDQAWAAINDRLKRASIHDMSHED